VRTAPEVELSMPGDSYEYNVFYKIPGLFQNKKSVAPKKLETLLAIAFFV
jgi:hypothetical protein